MSRYIRWQLAGKARACCRGNHCRTTQGKAATRQYSWMNMRPAYFIDFKSSATAITTAWLPIVNFLIGSDCRMHASSRIFAPRSKVNVLRSILLYRTLILLILHLQPSSTTVLVVIQMALPLSPWRDYPCHKYAASQVMTPTRLVKSPSSHVRAT